MSMGRREKVREKHRMSSITRLREYAASHGIGYTIRRIGEKADQVIFAVEHTAAYRTVAFPYHVMKKIAGLASVIEYAFSVAPSV